MSEGVEKEKIELMEEEPKIENNMARDTESSPFKAQQNIKYEKKWSDTLIDIFCQCFKKPNLVLKREIYINSKSGSSSNYTRFKNKIRNQKYNVVTFLPLVLFNQLKFFNNQFYFLLAASQFIDELKVGFLFSYVSPLVFVLTVTIIREAIDDIKRYRRDKEQNSQKFLRIDSTGRNMIASSQIKIGDLIEITQGQRIPADMLILKSYDHNTYIKTDQLDGETDWKLRKPIQFFNRMENVEDFFKCDCSFTIDPPSKHLYEFSGLLKVNSDPINDTSKLGLRHTEETKHAIGLENTIWMNAVLASKKLVGIIIYTGKETRAEMNSSLPKSKVGILDKEVNRFAKVLFILMVGLSAIITLVKGLTLIFRIDFIVFTRFIVLLCSIIPISLRINLDFAKAFFSRMISTDKRINGAIARNSQIPEELGRIQYIFSDKTGTLTKNEMIFKKIAFEMGIFAMENLPDLKMILSDECKANKFPMPDLINMVNNNVKNINIFETPKRIRRNQNKIIRDSITAITLCNNVTPIYNDNTGEVEYQASSPDEVALVKFAESINMRLTYRDEEKITLKNANDYEEHYEILAIFPFSSETKRMGIVLMNKDSKQKVFYLKGAENVLEKFVKEDYVSYIKENTEQLASSGLRTLVIAQKILDDDFYEKWSKTYKDALTSMDKRKEKIELAMNLLENKLEFLCVTGVEDQLQDEVTDTIESLKNAGIRIWMLTGDKIETATCIAISTGLKSKSQRLYFLRDGSSIEDLKMELEKLKFQNDFVLIIDGGCLDQCLRNCENSFFEVAMIAKCVACCRCSPTQKAKIIAMMKKKTNNRCLAIGDGGNDVAMIQEAHIGVGIVGKEGKQASLSSDFSINQFKDLKLLLLWFGRLAYKNTATISHFVIHRGLFIALLEFIFSMMFYCVPIALYNGNLMLGYTTIYTALPVLSLMYDQDTDISNVVKFPSLYKSLQKGRELSTKKFLGWFWKSVFQSSLIMFSSIFLFEHLFIKIATVTFTCLIFAELLNVYLEIKKFHWVMIISLVLTGLSYILSLVFLKYVLDLSYLSWQNLCKMMGITVVSWLPFYSMSKLQKCIFPEAHEKLNLLKEEN